MLMTNTTSRAFAHTHRVFSQGFGGPSPAQSGFANRVVYHHFQEFRALTIFPSKLFNPVERIFWVFLSWEEQNLSTVLSFLSFFPLVFWFFSSGFLIFLPLQWVGPI